MCALLDIIAALEEDGIRKVVLISGHGGNPDTMRAVLREHFDTTDPARRAFVCLSEGLSSPEAIAAIEHPSDHGGESETSRMLYLRPDLVHAEAFQEQPFGQPIIESAARGRIYYVRPWHKHVPLSAGGGQRKSTPEKGRNLIESAAETLANLLVELTQAPWNPDFPYPPGS